MQYCQYFSSTLVAISCQVIISNDTKAIDVFLAGGVAIRHLGQSKQIDVRMKPTSNYVIPFGMDGKVINYYCLMKAVKFFALKLWIAIPYSIM
ncbi:hypothetical protein CHUAL_012692 [Chamberlinius hualienensis]